MNLISWNVNFTSVLPNSYAISVFIPVTIAANGTIQLASSTPEGIQGLQAVTMANSGGAQQNTTILQYAQTPDGQQILVPGNQVVVQGKQTCHIWNVSIKALPGSQP